MPGVSREGSDAPDSAAPGNQRPRLRTRHWIVATRCLIGVAVVLVLVLFRDFGVAYDDTWSLTYGDYVLRWFASGFQDRNALTYWNVYHYGGLFEAPANLVATLLPLPFHEARHLTTALTGCLGLWGTARLGRAIGGARTGFLACLLLAFTPRYVGHAFVNSKDIPFAVAGVWLLAFFVKYLKELPAPHRGTAVAVGLSAGAALGIRVGGVVMWMYVLAALAVWWWFSRRSEPSVARATAFLRSIAPTAFLAAALSYLVMISFWPLAQVDPLEPARALKFFSHFPMPIPVYFDGRTVQSDDLPLTYFATMFSITLPVHLLLGTAVGTVSGGVSAWRILRGSERARPWRIAALTAVGLGAFLPIAYAQVLRPATYDGIRHFLFTLPPMCVIAALGFESLWRRVSVPVLRALVPAGLAVGLTVTGHDMIRLHPYEYIDFSRIAIGGLPGAAGRFETDYWGIAFAEAAHWLQNEYPVPPGAAPVTVGSSMHSGCTSNFITDPRFVYVGSIHDGQPLLIRPRVYLASLRWQGDEHFPGRVIHTVERMGVPLVRVIEVEPQ